MNEHYDSRHGNPPADHRSRRRPDLGPGLVTGFIVAR